PFTNIGGGYISNELPVALLVLLGVAAALGVLLHATRFGRYLYAIGSNREAARFSGIPVTRVRVTIFVLSGLMAGAAAIVYLGFFGSVQADAASGSELVNVVTAVVLGGVDIFGGSGSMLGVVAAGALAAGLAASVGSAGPSKTAAGSKVFLIPKFVGIPVFTQNANGAKLAAKELGDTIVYNGPTEASATAQVPFIDSAV